jgi:hypothetical protein
MSFSPKKIDESQASFQTNISPQFSASNKESKILARKELASQLAPEMEVVCSSETLVDFEQTVWHYIVIMCFPHILYDSCTKEDAPSPLVLVCTAG